MTTREAFRTIAACHAAIAVNFAHAVNRAVYRFPWAFIVAVCLVSFVLSYGFVAKARHERDVAGHRQLALQDTINDLRNQIDMEVWKHRK